MTSIRRAALESRRSFAISRDFPNRAYDDYILIPAGNVHMKGCHFLRGSGSPLKRVSGC